MMNHELTMVNDGPLKGSLAIGFGKLMGQGFRVSAENCLAIVSASLGVIRPRVQ